MLPGSDIVHEQILRAENTADQPAKLVLQPFFSAVEILFQIVHQTVEGHAVQAFLNGRGSGKIGHGPARRHAVSGGDQRGLQVGFQLRQDLIEPLFIVKAGAQHDLPYQLYRTGKAVLQGLGLHLEGHPALLQVFRVGEQVGHRRDAARFHVDLMEQLVIGMLLCVHIAQHRLQDPHIGKQLVRHRFQVEQEAEIADVVGEQLMIHHGAAV